MSYINVFVMLLICEVEVDDKVVVIMVVMLDGMGFNLFGEVFFEWIYDVGIVE